MKFAGCTLEYEVCSWESKSYNIGSPSIRQLVNSVLVFVQYYDAFAGLVNDKGEGYEKKRQMLVQQKG